MYPAISSFILSPNENCSNIFTSISRAIKSQGLTKHLQITATRSLQQTINSTVAGSLKNCDVKRREQEEEGNGSQDEIVWCNKVTLNTP
jgi:hypothetical protein